MFIVHAGDKIGNEIDGSPHWSRFFEVYKSHRCPDCVRAKSPHCIHQANFRNGASQQKQSRELASAMRDTICEKMWEAVCAGPDRAQVEQEMRARADAHNNSI